MRESNPSTRPSAKRPGVGSQPGSLAAQEAEQTALLHRDANQLHLVTEPVLHGLVEIFDPVGQAQFHRLATGPELTGEEACILRVDAAFAAGFHQSRQSPSWMSFWMAFSRGCRRPFPG
jgi:hypothetical protein